MHVLTDKRHGRISVTFDAKLINELRAEAKRLNLPIAQVAQQAWRLARDKMRVMPIPGGVPADKAT